MATKTDQNQRLPQERYLHKQQILIKQAHRQLPKIICPQI
jgi:hypothetical protein